MLSHNRIHEPLLIGLGLLVVFGPAAVVAQDAGAWLEKMDRAIHEESYQGTFMYIRGSQIDTVKVVHKFEDGKEWERLTSQNGEEREIIREGNQTVCYHLRGDDVDFSHGIRMGPFSHGFSKNLAANQSMYKVTLHGKDRVADRSTVRIRITPYNPDRYGYRLWLDEQSGLLLRSSLVSRQRILDVFQFSQIQIGGNIGISEFASSLPDDAVRHVLSGMQPEVVQVQEKHDWRVSWVPKGFRPVRVPVGNGKAFTDGVATLSVFIERTGKSLGNTQTRVGGTVVVTRQIKSRQITVVGEVPVATAQKVAESIEPVIY